MGVTSIADRSGRARKGAVQPIIQVDSTELRAKQIEVLYDQTPVTLLATFLTALVAVGVLWPYIARTVLVSWLLSMALITGARFGLIYAYERSPSGSKKSGRWLTEHLIGTGASGIAWGIAGIVLMPANELLPQIFTIFFIGGLLAGATGAYAVEMKSYFAFAAPASGLLALSLFSRNDEFGTTAGAMVLLFVGLTSFHARRLNKTLLHTLQVQFENTQLITDLEQLKRELEQRVAERTATLAATNEQLQEEIARSVMLMEKLTHQATHDALTNLVNRSEFERRLERVLQSAQANKTEHVLCYLDLDQFKVINDTCGHLAGDELLRQLPGNLLDTVRKRDTIARLGGDEFGILMEHCTLEQAKHTASALRKAIQDFRFIWENKSFRISASMGIVQINYASGTITDVLKQADAACYEAKDQGRNRIHFVEQHDAELLKRRGEIQWASRIDRALEEGRFRFVFQSISRLARKTNPGEHYELLLRLDDGEKGYILPGAFMPAAERYSFAVKLDCWVVRAAFEALIRHPDHLNSLYQCSINLSGHSLGDEEFRDFVTQQFRETEIPAEKICFEVTETAAIANLNKGTQFMKLLSELGCRFALDDFGSGLCSFAYLKNLPVDYLKIDGMFVKDLVADPMAFSMVKSINEIGHVMGKQTIAEYVADTMILEKLREIGVDYAQGYGIAAPRPIEELWGRSNEKLMH
jgi:diguanylate cyclase (GGDEF)-like protein